MLEVLDQTGDELIAIRISDELSIQDYATLRTLFDDRLDRAGALRWYVEMSDFSGWGREDLWADFILPLSCADEPPLSRVAFVGDKRWEDWIGKCYEWVTAIYPSQPEEVKFFQLERRREALGWVRDGE